MLCKLIVVHIQYYLWIRRERKMTSTHKQKENILKMGIKDKKLTRLFNTEGVSDRDILFLNFVYEERQELHFRYGVVLTGFIGFTLRFYMQRRVSTFSANAYCGGFILLSHLFWSGIVTKRFTELTDSYFQKYEIK